MTGGSDVDDFCMLGLWDFVDNRMRFNVGVGWNIKSPVPKLSGYDNRGRGLAGPYGYCYWVGNWTVYGRRLTNPVLARYQKYYPADKSWGGRHRADD
jgi:hypothetical protein